MSMLFLLALVVQTAASPVLGHGAISAVPLVGTDSLEHDVGVQAILSPVGLVPRLYPLTPSAVVANRGSNAEDFPVYFELPDGYLDTLTVIGLEPGQVETLDFETWTPLESGQYEAVAWTLLSGDEDPSNDTFVQPFYVDMIDVGVEGIRDSVNPRFRITNYGLGGQYLFVTFTLKDTTGRIILSTVQGVSVPSMDTVIVGVNRQHLPDFPCHVWLWHGLTGDENRSNDTGYFYWPGWPPWLELTAVIEPPPGGVIDSGDMYPQCVLLNHVGGEDMVPVVFNIDDWYDTTWVDSGIGQRTVTATSPWYASPGRHSCSMSTPDDDTVFTFVVRDSDWHDVAVESIIVPSSAVRERRTIKPSVLLVNHGTDSEFVYVMFIIDDLSDSVVYASIQGISIGVGDSAVCTFNVGWTAEPSGTYYARTWHGLLSDEDRTNDTLDRYFLVVPPLEHDVEVSAIYAPQNPVDSGASITPRCLVRNVGASAEYNIPVHFTLPGGYEEMTTVSELEAGARTDVSFPAWLAHFPHGDYEAVAWTLLTGDLDPANDTFCQPFAVQVRDIGVTEILWPVDTIPDSTLCYPRFVVTNFGTTTETFEVRFEIGLFVARGTVGPMPGRTSDTVRLGPPWLSRPGAWIGRAEVLPDPYDPNPSNNVMYSRFWVQPRTGVKELEAVPRCWSAAVRPSHFGTQTLCEFGLPQPALVDVTVCTTTGRLVRTLESATFGPGQYRIAWDGCDDAGRELGRGVYHLRFTAGEYRSTHKLVKLR
ncbi:MAG: hypothetical protein JSU73_01295 [candidate division WOR-3 bacterium]|nr:MAG: hypothetical protein JSU73_01295 [candidate division WOR-3 bacterium]